MLGVSLLEKVRYHHLSQLKMFDIPLSVSPTHRIIFNLRLARKLGLSEGEKRIEWRMKQLGIHAMTRQTSFFRRRKRGRQTVQKF